MRRPILVERSSLRPARPHRMAVSLLPGPVIVGPCPPNAWRFAAERDRPRPQPSGPLAPLGPLGRAGFAGPGGRVAGRERIVDLRLVAQPVGTLLGRPTRGPLPFGQQFLLGQQPEW